MKSKPTKKKGQYSYTDKQKERFYYETVYLSHTLEDKRPSNIARHVKYGLGLVIKNLNEYKHGEDTLGELALIMKSKSKFISICIKHKNLNK